MSNQSNAEQRAIMVTPIRFKAITHRAKEMHKEEIVNAVDGFPIHLRNMDGNDYYNEIFNNKEK